MSAPASMSPCCPTCLSRIGSRASASFGRPSNFHSLTSHRCTACHPPVTGSGSCSVSRPARSSSPALTAILDYLLLGLHSLDFRSVSPDLSIGLDWAERLEKIKFKRDSSLSRSGDCERSAMMEAVKLAMEHAKMASQRCAELSSAVSKLRDLTRESSSIVLDSEEQYGKIKEKLEKAKKRENKNKTIISNLEEQLRQAQEENEELRLAIKAGVHEDNKRMRDQGRSETKQTNRKSQPKSRSRSASPITARYAAPPLAIPERIYLSRLESERAAAAHQAEEDLRRARIARAKEAVNREKCEREEEKQRIRRERRKIIQQIKQIEIERRKAEKQRKGRTTQAEEESDQENNRRIERALQRSRAIRNGATEPDSSISENVSDSESESAAASVAPKSPDYDQFKLEINGTATIEPKQSETAKAPASGQLSPVGTFTMYRIAKAKKKRDMEQDRKEKKYDSESASDL